MCPHTNYYLDYYQADPDKESLCMGDLVPLREVYDYCPVPEVLSMDEQKYIKGIQGCVWTEYMPNFKRVEYMAFPRACAISETAWTPQAKKNWKSLIREIIQLSIIINYLNYWRKKNENKTYKIYALLFSICIFISNSVAGI